MMTTEKAPTPDAIIHAAARLLAVCDGAVAEDGRGYNRYDGPTVRSIMASRSKSVKQIRALYSILKKYQGQLAQRGINYEDLVPPELPLPPSVGALAANTMPKAPPPPPKKIEAIAVETQYGKQVALVFPYDANIVSMVKETKGRFFDKDGNNSKGLKNCWILKNLDVLVEFMARAKERLPGWPVVLDVEVEAALEDLVSHRAENLEKSHAESATIEIPTKIPLYPYQKAGVAWIDAHGGRALVGDVMGLGKTPQSLGWLLIHPEALPALVVCPSSIRVNWVLQAAKFTGFKCLVLTGKSSIKAFQKVGVEVALEPQAGYDLTIVNYDLFRWKAKEEPKDITKPKPKKKVGSSYVNGIEITKDDEVVASSYNGFKTMIFDEVHKLKDGKSQRSRVAKHLIKDRPYVLGLTGTPLMNRPIEIFNPMRLIAPKVFSDVIEFGKKYCGGYQSRFGWDFTGSSNLEELNVLLRAKGGMIRREKEQVLKELPEKTRVTMPLVLESKEGKAYEAAHEAYRERARELRAERDEWKAKRDAMSDSEWKAYAASHAEEAARKAKLTNLLIDEIEKVKQAAANAKFEEAMKFLLGMAESEEKFLVFATHHEILDRMVAAFQEEKVAVAKIDGRTPQADRPGIVESFQTGKLQVLVGGIRAMSEGLTLTAANKVAFMEFDWNPAQHDQAEDRVHRIGQKNAVTAYYLIAMGTVEEKIVKMIDAKRDVSFSALGEEDRMLREKGIMDSLLDDLT